MQNGGRCPFLIAYNLYIESITIYPHNKGIEITIKIQKTLYND